jgi:type VI secretion system protein ImpL
MLDMQRVFGGSGTMNSYVQEHLKPLLDTSGPTWRWQESNPVTAAMDPDSAEEFEKAGRIRDFLTGGLALRVSVVQFGSDTAAVEISTGNSTQKMDQKSPGPRVISWSPQANPEAYIDLYPVPPPAPPPAAAPATPAPAPAAAASGKDAKAPATPAATTPPAPPPEPPPPVRIAAEGPWALFRLMDKADKQNSGPQAIRATFRSGSQWMTVLLELPSTENPFGRGGIWSFRCPARL